MTNRAGRQAGAPLSCFIAGVQHESCSFSPIPTEMKSFETCRWGADPGERTLGHEKGPELGCLCAYLALSFGIQLPLVTS